MAFIEAQKCTISARQLSSFVGKVMSTCPVTGNLPRITTRHCQMTVAIAEHWDTPMILDEYCKDEIVFWKNNNIHLRNFKNCFVFRKPQKVTFSMLAILPAELFLISMTASMFATKCGRRTKGVEVLRGED